MVLRPGARQAPNECSSAHDRRPACVIEGSRLLLSTVHGHCSQMFSKKKTPGFGASQREDMNRLCRRHELESDEATSKFPKACYTLDKARK